MKTSSDSHCGDGSASQTVVSPFSNQSPQSVPQERRFGSVVMFGELAPFLPCDTEKVMALLPKGEIGILGVPCPNCRDTFDLKLSPERLRLFVSEYQRHREWRGAGPILKCEGCR